MKIRVLSHQMNPIQLRRNVCVCVRASDDDTKPDIKTIFISIFFFCRLFARAHRAQFIFMLGRHLLWWLNVLFFFKLFCVRITKESPQYKYNVENDVNTAWLSVPVLGMEMEMFNTH